MEYQPSEIPRNIKPCVDVKCSWCDASAVYRRTYIHLERGKGADSRHVDYACSAHRDYLCKPETWSQYTRARSLVAAAGLV